MLSGGEPPPARQRQRDRRARTRAALLEAAAQGMSRYGYAKVALERVASDAGYSRGALYHLFTGKEDLALAVVRWVEETWTAEVGDPAAAHADPVEALLALARGHAVYCRRDVATVLLTLRIEFAGQDHPVGRAITQIIERLTADCAALVTEARRRGAIPAGPPDRAVAAAYLSVLEALGIELAGQAPYDVELAERAVRGVLGLPATPDAGPRRPAANKPTAQPERKEDQA